MALAVATSLHALAAWRVDKHVDELTDKVTWYIYADGRLADEPAFFSARPSLVFRMTPKNVDPASKTIKGEVDAMVTFDPDAVRRSGFDALVRFDAAPAETFSLDASASRTAGLFSGQDSRRIFAAVRKSDKMLFRFTTSLGFTRTIRFDLSGFADAYADWKRQVFAALPEASPAVPASVTDD